MLNNDVTELVTEVILPLCDDETLLGKESLNDVSFWYLVPTNYRSFFVDLWELGLVECLILFHGSLFAGCSHRKPYRLACKGKEDADRIKKRVETYRGS